MSDEDGEQAGGLCEDVLQRIKEEIIPLFEQAISDDNVVFRNPHLIHCREKKGCNKEDCPVIGEKDLRCWQIAGTYCGGQVQGTFAEKYPNCRSCEVFIDACPTVVEELGENLNNMLFLLRKQKEQVIEKARKIDYLNKELISSLENLDSKNREIQELVITDKLTGLYNRHYLTTVLDDEILRCYRKGYTFSLLMIDIDDFKGINDSYGHLAGDKILTSLGAMIKSVIRKYDRAFRYGGEEFVVILPETNLTIAWMVAERIRGNFAREKFLLGVSDDAFEGFESRTLSIGCASYSPGLTSENLVKQADEAMYSAKSQGKNMVVRFDELK